MFGNDSEYLFEGLIEMIGEWEPKNYPDEKQYKQALYTYLKDLQERGRIKAERTIRTEAGESRADIRVSDVVIELKKKLDTKSHRDRAENQIRLMLKEFSYVIVVIVGKDHNREAIDTFKHHLKEFIHEDDFMGNGNKIRVIEVGKNKGKRINKKPNNPFGLDLEMPKIDILDFNKLIR